MTKSYCFVLFFLLIIAAGCTDSSVLGQVDRVRDFSLADESARSKQSQRSQYLAYSHQITIDVAESAIANSYDSIVQHCLDDAQFQCTILQTNLSKGEYPSGSVKLRIMPAGVKAILSVATEHGDISRQSTDIEDLGDAIIDNEKRLEMLTSYRDRLTALESKSKEDIESLIKISSELSTVQSDLEYATGEKAELLQRVNMDIVRFQFESERNRSFSQSIKDTVDEFSRNLSNGIAQAITFFAYLLPMLFILVPVVFLLKWIWQRRKS